MKINVAAVLEIVLDLLDDADGDVFHTPNRQYSQTLGRWMTPDPAGLAAVNPMDPQSWNRYAYVTNNPTTYNDPSGLFMGLCNSPENRQCSTNDPSSGNIGVTWNELSLYTLSITPTGIATSNADLLPFLNSELGRMLALLSGQAWLVYGNADMFYWSAPGGGPAANNGSWFQRTLNYLKSVPWTLSIIASTPEEPIGPAFTMAYNPSTGYLCAGGGLGASVGRNFSVGPLVVGNLQNQNAILSGASISVGAQATPLLGAQAVGNNSGILGEPTAGIPGGSATATYSWCGTIP